MGVLADHVDMAGFAFEPSQVTLEQGSDLTVTNKDSVTHTFTMDDGSIDETLEPGQTADVTIASAGGFHCDIHKSMTGTVSFG
jgi:plastocyanin